jgi:hypothetical protein
MSSNSNPICGMAYFSLFIIVGLSMIYDGVRKYLLIQKIKDTPTSKVDAAAVGLVELAGKAECHIPIASPITKNRCAYWRVLAQYFQPGKGGGRWVEFFRASSGSLFYLQDDTGKMLVDPNNAQVEIPSDNLFQGCISGTGEFGMAHTQMEKRVLDYIDSLDDKGKKAYMKFQHEDVRVYEYFIAEGDTLFVLGSAEPRGDAPASAVAYENLMLRQGKEDKTMYISDSGERKVLDTLSSAMWHQFAIGLLMSAIGMLLLLVTL